MVLEYFVPIRQLPHLRKLTLSGLSCKLSAELSDALATLLPTLTTLTALRLDAENDDTENVIALDMCELPITLESLTAIGYMTLHMPKAIALPYLTKLCTLGNLVDEEPIIFVPLMNVCFIPHSQCLPFFIYSVCVLPSTVLLVPSSSFWLFL